MYFTMRDFNGDGKPDILYVNGDNFDYSRVLKPYHGIRILENDGHNNFAERDFFPVYGAAQAVVADFDKDGDRKSTRLNSSHLVISYAVFCLKKKKKK